MQPKIPSFSYNFILNYYIPLKKYYGEDKGEGRERPLNGMLSPSPSYAALYYARDLLPGREGDHRAICEFPHAQGVQV